MSFLLRSWRASQRTGLLSRRAPIHGLRTARQADGQQYLLAARSLTSTITIDTLQRQPELDSFRKFIEEYRDVCEPKEIYICDGSEEELRSLTQHMIDTGVIRELKHPSYENCYLARSDPADVARVETKTYVCTPEEEDIIAEGARRLQQGQREGPNWMPESKMDMKMRSRLEKSMKNRRMYVIPFSMGKVGSPLAKAGVQLTDSPYVVASMRIMTHGMGQETIKSLLEKKDDFVRCVHSVGRPMDQVDYNSLLPSWPCDPKRVLIAHYPRRRKIVSYGSGYGGNSLLGKKCFALRLASAMGHNDEKNPWYAEHMLIMRLEKGDKHKYIAAAFPSACGKTNLAMMQPSLDGWDIKCVGDDIAWMRFDEEGNLRAINPENGFFGVAPGTSAKTNPVAMKMIHKNTIFTNVAYTEEGEVFWENMGAHPDFSKVKVITWRGVPHWRPNMVNIDGIPITASHPNSRFCTPINHCSILDKEGAADPKGVKIDAIVFGGRRADTVPLVFQSRNWKHGVLMGASMRSGATAAATDVKSSIRSDPFAMLPFFGYNVGNYFQHWLNMEKPNHNLPKIFQVNWFQKDERGQFMWPGFGENIRVLDWIFRRCDEQPAESGIARETPIGFVPSQNAIDTDGLKDDVPMDRLLDVNKHLWTEELKAVKQYLEKQNGNDLPQELRSQLRELEDRLAASRS
ncbi:phosphoenolpyruvate carboxykinase, cytosolic [GTP]-like [Sycon ciliatum]|uniref:phosphoenolpyruvate carboxykinase, cytosolic [GTP]-like n=1 Tax=Sycon ciliatum TaxID=27933 RepID=UPI0031F6AF2A|eukprot:scpid39276/ scgid27434/ Phosphoenolpyruvate carboxykinase, cytosolic [GTP]; Phosphoenolpyruvate carboxylase